MKNANSLPRCPLHPATIKHLKKGNPWITKDRFSLKFPQKADLFVGVDEKHRELGLFLHDPTHPKIKGRLWQKQGPYEEKAQNFVKDFRARLEKAINKRVEMSIPEERENYYIAFGEADDLPGLKIQTLGNIIIVQFYAYLWEKHKDLITTELKRLFSKEALAEIRFQTRNAKQKQKEDKISLGEKCETFKEFGITYQTLLNERYDIGIYTDAAGLRKRLTPLFKKSERFLNLYSYTGAFSLYALKQGVSNVHSVDMSKKACEWLEENLALNRNEFKGDHKTHCAPADKALRKLIKEGHSFDLILSDPPPSSFDGKKKLNALEQTEKLLDNLPRLLSPEGTLILLLNHHQISLQKFHTRIEKLLHEKKMKTQAEYALQEDCLPAKNIPEENYLKVLFLKKNSRF